MTCVLVTGASGSIGGAIVRALTAGGMTATGTARRPAAGEAALLALDVTDPASVVACVDDFVARHGRIDALVNNAGFDLYGGLEETSWEEFMAQMDTNFFGAVRMTQAVLPRMRAQGGGRIVNIGSLGGLVGLPLNSAYAASKFALEGFGESLRLELLPDQIYVSVIEPPAVATETLEQSIREVAATTGPLLARRRAMVPQMRAEGRASPVKPEHVAAAVLRALRDPQPLLRYPVGGQARWIPRLKALLPQRSFEKSLRGRWP
ncbi:MAG: SDR family NAD(P)-dependent oxidoreductase [Betaproteobacteria bacterium]